MICAAAHGCGLLTNQGALDWHVADDKTKELGRSAGEYCKKQGIELGKLAIWFAAQLEGPATFLVGMSTREIVNINLDSFNNGLTQKEREVLDYCMQK